jgi:hypothetical protein
MSVDGRLPHRYSGRAGPETLRTKLKKPFIYIGALRRTGSTMLCEALTRLPHSIVFNEPNIAFRRFVIRGNEAQLLLGKGIDLHKLIARWSIGRRRLLLTGFRHQIVPAIARQVSQVGIKEIFHANWRHVLRSFPGMKIVLTARDPRDIYLSLRARYDSGAAIWKGEFSPARVAASLNEEFHYQLEMFRENTVFKARYEDLCLDTDLFRQVFEFVESDLTEVGKLGSLLTADDKRVAEGELHDGKVTDQRVARWKKEKSEKLLDESFQVLNAMPEFCEFWHYQR